MNPSFSNGFDAKTITATKNVIVMSSTPETYGISSRYLPRLNSTAATVKVASTIAQKSSDPFCPA